MATVETLRNGLIEKIQAIKDKEFLIALDHLIASGKAESDILELSEAQKELLDLAEQDVATGALISQEELDQRNLKWLDAM